MNAVKIYENANWKLKHNEITFGEFETEIEPLKDVAKVKHGEWQGTVCSSCGASVSNYYDCDFCPKCGADMQNKPHWINHVEYGITTYATDKDVECSECHHKQPNLFNMNFCPNCGADMRGETE